MIRPTDSAAKPAIRRPAIALAALLFVSIAVRIVLAADGGQYFLGDESRFHRGTDLYLALQSGDWERARGAAGQPEHSAFVGLVAALAPVQRLLAGLSGHGDWSDPANIYASAPIAAAILGLFSAASVGLIYLLARLLGADTDEALWSAALAAASSILLMNSRHLLPYDVATTVWLLALIVGLRTSAGAAFSSGALGGMVFHFYNGFWFLPMATAGFLAIRHGRLKSRGRLALWWFAGLAAGVGIPVALGVAAAGDAYLSTLVAFSGTVTQGLFSEGWSLPWEYLWNSESLLLLLLLGPAPLAALFMFRGEIPVRIRQAIVAVALIYAALVLASNALEKFVVYGRSVRPILPLLCLIGGWAVARLLAGRRWPQLALVAALAAAAAFNALPQFGALFPLEIERRVLANVGMTKRWLSFSGCIYRPLAIPVDRPDLALCNAQYLFPLREHIGLPDGEPVFSVDHPLKLPVYQYEGHTPRERRLLREHDISIKLIRLAAPALVPEHPPPGLQFTDADRPDGHGRTRD